MLCTLAALRASVAGMISQWRWKICQSPTVLIFILANICPNIITFVARCALAQLSATCPRVYSPAFGSGKEYCVSTCPTLSAERPSSCERAEWDCKKKMFPRHLSLLQQQASKGNGGGGTHPHHLRKQKINFSCLWYKLNSKQAASRSKQRQKRERKNTFKNEKGRERGKGKRANHKSC